MDQCVTVLLCFLKMAWHQWHHKVTMQVAWFRILLGVRCTDNVRRNAFEKEVVISN